MKRAPASVVAVGTGAKRPSGRIAAEVGVTNAPPQALCARSQVAAPLMRLQDVAAHCGVSLRTVQGWRAQGRLRVLQLGPRCLRVEPSELERFKREAQA